jgi:PTS system fructose-specific IIC component
MQYLQNIATALLDSNFNDVILHSQDRAEIVDTIVKAIEKKETPTIMHSNNARKGFIVGVSSCATGVAHTYMAREALEKHADDINYDI